MGAEKLQKKEEIIEENKELSEMVTKIKKRAGEGKVKGPGSLGEMVTLKSLDKREKLSLNGNGKEEKKKEVVEDSKAARREELPKSPDPASESAESSSLEEKAPAEKEREQNEKSGNLSNLVEVGDPVLLAKETSDGKYIWFIKEIKPNENSEDIITIEYSEGDPDLKEEREVRWEDITPRYDSLEMYEKKLRQYEKGLEKATAAGNDFYRYHLGKVLDQISHFAQIYYNNHQK